MPIITSPTGAKTPATVLAESGPEWMTCATDLIHWLVANGRCFSSGEIAHYIRIHRPDVQFSVTALGDAIRDWYYGQEMPAYDTGYPAMVPRTTEGKYRTAAGVPVFVYAPSEAEGLAHDFEVDVPMPPEVRPRPATHTQTITGTNKPQGEVRAVVRSDRRCVVPRSAFEFFVHTTGRTIRIGTDPVHIDFVGSEVRITLDPTPTSTPYHLWAGRGRVAFAGKTPFTPGDTFPIYATPTALVVRIN